MPHPGPSDGRSRHGGGWGDINIHIDINMNIDIHIIINTNVEDYKKYHLLFIKYSLLGIPYWVVFYDAHLTVALVWRRDCFPTSARRCLLHVCSGFRLRTYSPGSASLSAWIGLPTHLAPPSEPIRSCGGGTAHVNKWRMVV